MTMSRRWLAIAAALGIFAGLVAAFAIPTAQSTPAEPPFEGLPGKLKVAPTRVLSAAEAEGRVALRPEAGTLREELRRPDPAGGPDWVVRSMIADRTAPPIPGRPRSGGVIGSGPCFQLGREVGGRFGWIDGDNVFRPVSSRSSDGMSFCASAKIDVREHDREPRINPVTLVAAPSSLEPTVRGGLVWGMTGARVKSMRLTVGAHRATPRRSARWGAFLEFFGPSGPVTDADAAVVYNDGKRVDTSKAREDRFAPPGYRPDPGDAIVPGSSTVIARAPDPGGGPSWAVGAVRTRSGLWCLEQAGHLVGDRVGQIEPMLGTLWETPSSMGPNGCGPRAQPTKQYPVQAVSSSGSYTDVPGLAPERKQLRLQAGRTLIYGRILDGIDRLTVTTPRDVRTVVPTEPGRGFLLVYDGGFPGGKLTAVAHFADGRTKTVDLPGGGM